MSTESLTPISPTSETTLPTVKKDDPEKPKIIWTDQTEEVLRTWGDISSCYKWLHDKSYRKYKKKNYNYKCNSKCVGNRILFIKINNERD